MKVAKLSGVGLVGAFLLAACAGTSDDAASTTADLATPPPHVDPFHHGSPNPSLAGAATANYYGGRVISNAKVYVVYWGDGSNLDPKLTKATGGIADFYTGILDSPYMDGLTEYSTNRIANAGSHKGQQGSNQIVGRGNYAGTIALTAIPSSTNLTDEQVQATIESAVTAGKLPQPDDNTLFQIYFPGSVSISIDGMGSCSSFGGYHEQTANMHIAYSVLPACYGFAGIVSVSSHELVEAITDVLPTPGSHPDFPQAWNDSGGNEMGDLCETSSSNYATSKGSFYVQAAWYESVKGCKITNVASTDFIVQGSAPVTLAAGATTTVTYKLSATGAHSTHAGQSLALAVTAPAGVTATLGSATANTGDTVTVTLTADAGATVADGQVVLLATGVGAAGATRIHSAATLVKVH